MTRRLRKPCIKCGRPTTHRSGYCHEHEAPERADRQPYAVAYHSAVYRRNRKRRLKIAGGKCELCGAPAVEVDHIIPLSVARSGAEALALCELENLRAVCFAHNPRGSRPNPS